MTPEQRIRRLEIGFAASIVAGFVCVVLVFSHLMHDAHEFQKIWQTIAEKHRNDHR